MNDDELIKNVRYMLTHGQSTLEIIDLVRADERDRIERRVVEYLKTFEPGRDWYILDVVAAIREAQSNGIL